MANRRNTQRTPPRRAPVDKLEDNVNQAFKVMGDMVARLQNQQAIFERAFISLAQDVEAIAEALDEQYSNVPDFTDYRPSSPGEDFVGVDPEDPNDEPEETPAEEAERLVREAQQIEDERRAAAERMNEGA